jgi:hypothetical protein
MHHDAGRPPEQTGSSMESRIPLEAPSRSRAAAGVAGHLRNLHVTTRTVLGLGLGWAVVWGGWAIAHAGWVPARQDGLTLAAVSASAGWLSALLGALALGDLVRFNRRWALGEYHSGRRVTVQPLWLPPVLFLAGLAFGRLIW